MKYFEIKNRKSFYNNVELQKIIQKEKTPTKVVFLDVIEKQIKILKNAFNIAIDKLDYKKDFVFLNASKANYNSEIIFTAIKYSDGAETSSYHDLELTSALMSLDKNLKDKPIYCNGLKTKAYCDKIVSLHNKHVKIIDIVDDINQLEYLLSQDLNNPLEIGVRINLTGLYGDKKENDRFGLSQEALVQFREKLKNQNKLLLTTVHFHQRGMVFNEKKFYTNIKKICCQYAELKKQFPSLTKLDIGGGAPYSYDNDVDYNIWAENLIKVLKVFFDKRKIDVPSLIMENGKYTVKDSMINLYSVVGTKKTNNDFLWYLLNTSLVLAIPEYYMCGEEMRIVPVNNLENKMVKTKLAGITCDCDDIYSGENGYLLMPEIKDENQYIAILGTGSYQESLTSYTGIRHCLIPAEKRVISFIKNGKREFITTNNFQTKEDIFQKVNFNKEFLKQFID